jgi:tetratricopeptide (TPR) repeat protein
MPPRNKRHGRIALVRGIRFSACAFSACACGVLPLAAQDALQLQRDYPGSAPFVCPAPATLSEPSPQQMAQAGQLASEADNAVILGDYERAQELLVRAYELDPTRADFAYSHARVLEALGRTEPSMLEYCRAIALGAEAASLQDARDRLNALDEELRASISPLARERFADGLARANIGSHPEAVAAFTRALEERPDWPEALYNRAVVLERMGLTQESLVDYRRYLELRPAEVDPRVAQVAQRIGMLEGIESVPTPSPGNTLALGMLFPGMGQYYSDRGVSGSIILGTAVTAVAAGLSYRKITVRCLSNVSGGADCPPDDIVDETTERPLLGPALGVVAAVTLGAAVEAWIRARQARAEQERDAATGTEGLGFSGPSVSSNGQALDLSFFSLRFR